MKSAMLKNVNPLLNADVLYALRAMGHGDDLVITDANFPAESTARVTAFGRLLHIDAPLARVVEAVLSVYPLDASADDAAGRMEVSGAPGEVPEVQQEAQTVIDAAESAQRPLLGIERFAFYERAKNAFAVIQSAEPRFYGNIALRKGVVPPEN